MIDPLINDPDAVVIATHRAEAGDKALYSVSKFTLEGGHFEVLATAPASGPTRFLLDSAGQVRFATIPTSGLRTQSWQRSVDKPEWAPLAPVAEGIWGAPLAMSDDGQSVFLEARLHSQRTCLVEQILATAAQGRTICDETADLAGIIKGFTAHAQPIAAVFEAGKPEIKLLDDTGRDGALLKLLIAAFPDKVIEIPSVTRDGRKALVFTRDDRTQGDYYIFDTETGKADYLLGLRLWLDPDRMGERRPITLKARDGTSLHGYLTLPSGGDVRKLPLVVHPHGGPIGIRDDRSFDTDPQLLASRGYAVLQINFRGSSGYGSDFADAGKRSWGTTMIDDITDATRWVIEQGYADEKRVCIYDWSYGGYASLMSAVREPALYRCVVAAAGIYDVNLFWEDSDIATRESGRYYFSEAIAGTFEEMAAASPITYAGSVESAGADRSRRSGSPDAIQSGQSPASRAEKAEAAVRMAGQEPREPWLHRREEPGGVLHDPAELPGPPYRRAGRSIVISRGSRDGRLRRRSRSNPVALATGLDRALSGDDRRRHARGRAALLRRWLRALR
ncbi:prolyl oligopeptidase family serine peptidase [Nevskia ramosa]|uniref:alpha/beta hydrolase family protein n=1 Tax=Nevskia ramosa TaxID=64002 RepID=UPI00235509AA